MLLKEDRLEVNYDTIKYNYIEELMEHGYSRAAAENTDDGRDEFIDKEYAIYIKNYKDVS